MTIGADASDGELSDDTAAPPVGGFGGSDSEGEDAINDRVPSVEFLLKELRDTPTFASIRDDSEHLSKVEIELLLDTSKVKWVWLRDNIIESIVKNTANKKSQLPSATKRHTKRCMELD